MSGTTEESLSVGATATYGLIIQSTDLASNIATDPEADRFPRVLATSRLIAFMEIAAARLLQSSLQSNQLSVGTRIDVKHSVPTPIGSRVIAEAKFIGKQKKIFLFEVTAKDEAGEIGRGTHERAIVDITKLEDTAKNRTRTG